MIFKQFQRPGCRFQTDSPFFRKQIHFIRHHMSSIILTHLRFVSCLFDMETKVNAHISQTPRWLWLIKVVWLKLSYMSLLVRWVTHSFKCNLDIFKYKFSVFENANHSVIVVNTSSRQNLAYTCICTNIKIFFSKSLSVGSFRNSERTFLLSCEFSLSIICFVNQIFFNF